MEIESVIKSIVEKKVNSMSFDEVMNFIFHGGPWFRVENCDYRVQRDKIKEGLTEAIGKMKKDEIFEILKNSWSAIDGAAENFADCIGVCGVIGVDKKGWQIAPYCYDSADDWDEVLRKGRNEVARVMEKEYMEKVENKVGEILESL